MTKITDLRGIDVEHMLGLKQGPLVKIRCEGPGVVLRGQVDPAAARQIATHPTEAAARAEYEADLFNTMRAEGWEDKLIAVVFDMVRRGEVDRLTPTQGLTE